MCRGNVLTNMFRLLISLPHWRRELIVTSALRQKRLYERQVFTVSSATLWLASCLSLCLPTPPKILCLSKQTVYAILHSFFPSATPFSTTTYDSLSLAWARMRNAGDDEQDNGSRIEITQIQSEWSGCHLLYVLVCTRGCLSIVWTHSARPAAVPAHCS
jgi:hypothetical protein